MSDVITIIPARGGSRRVPAKNLLKMQGLPMIAYSILHARNSASVSHVYVSTDDDEIAAVSKEYGAEIITRPAELATDTATSEVALLHAVDAHREKTGKDPALVVFLQCTSPVRRVDDIDRAVEHLRATESDSLFSACLNNRLIWSLREGQPYSLTYNHLSRKREQDMEIQYRENGSIYVFRPEILRKYDNRLGDKMTVFEMDYWSSFQLDDPEHAELLEWILERSEFQPARTKA